MSGRRMGGMGGPQRGNRSFSQQPFQGGGVSPWQGAASNNMNQGLISQITSNPQLALALTSLLQTPQQQQMNNPPSLLSLNTSPAFSNQDRDFNRFGRGREIRRHEPYNKNRGGWRPMDNKNRNKGGRDRKRSPGKKDDKKDKKADKSITKKDDDTIDLSIDEDGDKETKRDWKDEKNQSEDKKDESGDEGQPKEKRNKEGKYTDVPVIFLKCFVCNKEMWDGESMEKHIRGRAHQQMLKSLEESIHITVGILRENMRLIEERKVIEWNRMNRLKKYSRNEPESNCNMCDLKFMGKIIAHRKTEGHQRLKRYLHPDCNMCNKEFPSRMEWIEHRLTPDHLRKLNEHIESQLGGVHGKDIVTDEQDIDLEPLLDEALQMEVENPILELDDNLEGLQNLMPAYKSTRPVSTKSLKPFSGFMCELCNRSFHEEELAQEHLRTRKHYYAFVKAVKEKHMKKERKEKKEKKEREAAEKEKEEAVKAENGEVGDQEMYDPEEATNEEESAMETSQEIEEGEGDPSVVSQDQSQEEMEPEEQANDVKQEVKEEEVEEEEEEKKEEPKKTPATPAAKSTPARNVKATAAAAAAAATNVKNGAGPKSRKARKQ